MNEQLGELKSRIRAGRGIALVGAGVSIASVGGEERPTWPALVKSGADFAAAHDSEYDAKWAEQVTNLIDLSQLSGRPSDLIAAASMVSSALHEIGASAYSSWLQSSVGGLAATDHSWIDALAMLQSPILTTNYDTLIEQRLSWTSSDWTDVAGLQRAYQERDGVVGHLHGVWSKPNSVILSDADYVRMLASEGAQQLQKAAMLLGGFILIGFGSSLDDPNFARLLEWHRRFFADSQATSFRLCRTEDYDELVKLHANDKITPIAYGDQYADLPTFVKDLMGDQEIVVNSAGLARNVSGEAREQVLSELREGSIVAGTLPNLASLALEDLLVAPSLLALPESGYLADADPATRGKIEKLDPKTECELGGVLLVVGDENSGLTTALRWLLLTATAAGNEAPILLSFRSFTTGMRPLERAIRREMLSQGLLAGKNDALPDHVIAIDDLVPFVKNVSDRTIQDIAALGSRLTIIGCRSGDEAAIAHQLSAAGIAPRIRFLARMRNDDVAALARILAPTQYEGIAAAALTIARVEHLPRTPLTLSLIISILVQGNLLAANASPTSILDQFVELVLGRGDAHEDARFALDSAQLAAILGDLARAFVELDQGSISEAEAIHTLQNYFGSVGWKESATEVLVNLVNRRVLRRHAGQIGFTQSSFLHLFAAKRMAKNDDFRSQILERPVYYAPLVRHYAALSRQDAALVRFVTSLLDGLPSPEEPDRAFLDVEIADAPDDLEARIDAARDMLQFPEGDQPDVDAQEPPALDLDVVDDRDTTPFPLTDESGMGDLTRRLITLDLVSVVLRDSDQVEDNDLKADSLAKVLDRWGETIAAIENDESFIEAIRSVVENVTSGAGSGQLPKEFMLDFLALLPPSLVATFVSGSLSSRKLLIALERVLDDHTERSREADFAAALLVADIAEPGWVEQYKRLVFAHPHSAMKRRFLIPWAAQAYAGAESGSPDLKALEQLIMESAEGDFKFKSTNQRVQYVNALRERLRNLRLGSQRPGNELDVH